MYQTIVFQLNELSANMQRIYSTATVCDRPGDSSGTCYPLDPGIDILSVVVSSRGIIYHIHTRHYVAPRMLYIQRYIGGTPRNTDCSGIQSQ